MAKVNADIAWAYYVIITFLGLYFNSSLIISITKLQKRTSIDILIGGLSGAIIYSCLTCNPFCFANLIKPDFLHNKTNCFLQSVGHITGILMEILCIGTIAYRTYVGVVKNQSFSNRKAYQIVASVYIISIFGVLFFSLFSRTYIVSSGTFCFFEWTSIVLIVFVWPCGLLSMGFTAFWYFRTYQVVKQVRQAVNRERHEGGQVGGESEFSRELAIRLSILVGYFILCYFPIITVTLYEIVGFRAGAWHDTISATMGVVYWVGAPFAYARTNKRLGWYSVVGFKPAEYVNLNGPSFGLDSIRIVDKLSRTDKVNSTYDKSREKSVGEKSVGESPPDEEKCEATLNLGSEK